MRRIAASLPAIAGALAAVAAVTIAGPISESAAPPGNADVTVIGEAIGATPRGKVIEPPTSAACVDTAYTANRWRLTGTYTWYYNPTGAPASVAGTALPTIQTATQTAVSGQNRCGTAVTLPIRQSYAGAVTNRSAQVSATGICTGNDGRSVTSWGTLPVNYLAYTCVYYSTSTGAVLASDMLLSNSQSWFTTLPPNCANSYDLESTVVHERGHTIGLGHVDQATHAILTMSPATTACTTYKRLLGAGDLAGIRAVTSRR